MHPVSELPHSVVRCMPPARAIPITRTGLKASSLALFANSASAMHECGNTGIGKSLRFAKQIVNGKRGLLQVSRDEVVQET